MKKILYDHQIFEIQKFGGISRYFCELMKHSEGLFEGFVGGIFSDNFYANELGFHSSFPIKSRSKHKKNLQKWFNERNSVKKMKRADIVHPTYYDHYFSSKNDRPVVLTVHDMVHELFPNRFRDYPNKKLLIEHSTKIIAISQNTKKDILRFFPHISEEKISVIYHGTSWSVQKKIEKKQNYILFTGDRTFYKNFNNFIIAIAPLLIKYDLQLKCTGRPLANEEINLLKQQRILERTVVNFADEQELKKLYANALCFVFPSLYEGFGIPILEAFACGCPLICSETSCFPEIAGNAAEYFDPCNIEDMREKIDKIICSETLKKDLVNNGFERLKVFSWQKCAEQTTKIYERC